MSRIGMRRVAWVLCLSVLFGALTSVVKGNGSGVRDAVGNVSATWLIVPLLAGWYATPGRVIAGAATGLAATMTAILGFYATNAFVLDLGSHSTLRDLALSLRPGTVLAPFGAVTGAVLGTIGAVCSGRRSSAPGWIIAGLLICEPPVLIAYFHARGIALSGSFGNPWVWVAEIAAGVVVATATWRWARAHPG